MPMNASAVCGGQKAVPLARFRLTHASGGNTLAFSTEIPPKRGGWTVLDGGAAAGFSVDPANGARLRAPDLRPAGLLGIEAIGGTAAGDFQSAVLPWFGEIHKPAGEGGAIVGIDAATRLSLRTRADQHPRELRVHGADTAAAIGSTITLYALTL